MVAKSPTLYGKRSGQPGEWQQLPKRHAMQVLRLESIPDFSASRAKPLRSQTIDTGQFPYYRAVRKLHWLLECTLLGTVAGGGIVSKRPPPEPSRNFANLSGSDNTRPSDWCLPTALLVMCRTRQKRIAWSPQVESQDCDPKKYD